MHVSNIDTKPMGKSDHHIVSFNLKMKEKPTIPNKDKIMKIVVRSAQFIYGENTCRLSHVDLFEKVGFLRKKDYFEVAAATWMYKIINNAEPEMITDYVRHSSYRAACKVAPKIKPKSTCFKCTAIASGIYYYNKLNSKTAALPPKKCKALIKKMITMGMSQKFHS